MIVHHQNGTYPVEFCSWSELQGRLPQEITVITDENVAAHWNLPAARTIVVPAGEASKSGEQFLACHSALAQAGARRSHPIVALGGGVVGDLAGFVAATYQRGVPLIQVPTSLLAMVDSSVGGKVAVDLPEGKNLVGAFYPPMAVYVIPETLRTLPEREFRNGLAEALKYGFIANPALLDRLQPDAISAELVEACIDEKRRVVEADEFETNGLRATLNFGHTIGHALEQLTGYSELKHGEAISIGMVAEADLGEYLQVTAPGTAQIVRSHLERVGLPVTHSLLEKPDELIPIMLRDKKGTGADLAFSLLLGIGKCKLCANVAVARVRDFLIRP